MLNNPDLMNALADLAVAVVGLVMTVVLPLVSAKVYAYTGWKIEEKHMKALHEAAATWAQNSVLSGPGAASTEAGRSLEAYLRKSVPDAMKALAPTADVLIAIAGRYLRAKAP